MASEENENHRPVSGHKDDVTHGEKESVGRLDGTKPKDYEESLFIRRRVKFAFDKSRKSCPLHNCFIADLAKRLGCFGEELSGECSISLQGQIEWFVDGERRKQIWENIKQMNEQTSGKIEEDSHLIEFDEERNEHPVIICGLAGTGKSTLLSHYYSEIKKKKPDCWIIRLNLVEHSDAILKFDTNKPDFIGFLIDHIHVIDSKSPFSRSLLNHRFDTGKQIVFMFDGYDEIGKECQAIAIQMMKSIQKKSIQLYVTTRSHMAFQLQYELGQLAYYVENFNKQDQIDCLTKYWKKELKLPDRVQGRLHKMKIKKIKKIQKIEECAKLLVDRVSKTLKDEERALIGIPLQCMILAECYLQNVDNIVRRIASNNGTRKSGESQKPLRLFGTEKFDLVSLYGKLMDTKRKIFLEEKTNTPKSDEIKDDAITILLKKIECRLIKLAVETIIPEPNILEMFWPTKSSTKSSEDVARKESILAKNTLKFGLTFPNEDGMRPQFLHRTFAEYLVAKYLYEGFHLDEERRNKLLENESIRKLILNKILASEQYDGVQMFFDCMLKTLVDEDERWRRVIVCRQLPDPLIKLTENLFTQFLRNYPPVWAYDRMTVLPHYFANALRFSLSNGKGNIFLLLCDCLDATFEKQQIHWAMYTSFILSSRFISSPCFGESKFFKRFINYFDIDPHDSSTYHVIDKVIKGMFPYHPAGIIESNSFWKRDGHQQTMKDLLQFLENQHVAFDEYVRPDGECIKPILEYLIFHGNNRSHLERFLKLLSKSAGYPDDLNFINVLIEVFRSKEQMMTGQIAETLNILKKIGQSTLFVQLYAVVLSKEPEAFRNIYQPFRLEEVGAIPTDCNILLKRDEYGMTLLHGAAFYGDVDIVDQILARFRQPELDDRAKTAVHQVVLEGYTPFYFAAAKNQKEVCSKLLAFVNDIFPDALKDELTELNRSIRQSLDHAMESENAEMFQLILNVVKKELGHDYLFDLLISKPTASYSILNGCRSEKLVKAMTNIVVDRNGIADYKCLNDLIFGKKEIARYVLQCMDAKHLQELLSVDGAGPFTKRLLTNDIPWNFGLLSSYLLKNFNETHLSDFVEIITLQNDSKIANRRCNGSLIHLFSKPNDEGTTTVHAERLVTRNSFWVDFLRSVYPTIESDVCYIFECVSDKLGGDCAKQLFLHRDDDVYVVFYLPPRIVRTALKHLPKESQEEIKKEWIEKLLPMTHDSFINSSISSWNIAEHHSEVLRFYLDYGSEVQLSNCVNVLTSVRLIDGQQRSVWSYIFERCGVTTTNDILKSVAVIFGWKTAKKLLLHEMDGFPLLLKAVQWGDDIDGRLDMLPQEIRNDIQQAIERKAAEFIELFQDLETFFGVLGGPIYKRLNTLIFLIKYSNAQQLEKFVKNITTLQISTRTEETLSLWAQVFTHPCDEAETNNVAKMNTFLKCVSEKLDTNAVKELVLHEIDDVPVIFYPALRGEEKMVEAMLAHLDAKNRKQIQRQSTEFLNKTFQVPRDDVLTDSIKEALSYL